MLILQRSIPITCFASTAVIAGAVLGSYWFAKENSTVKNVATGVGLGTAFYIAAFPFSIILPKFFKR